MCGLAGVAAPYISDKHRKVFQELMIGSMMRGYHASGAAVVFREHAYHNQKQNPPEFLWDKTVGTPVDLFQRRSFDTLLKKTGARALIGHCRHGTVGQNVRSNAHPFQTATMIGCHNGTIQSTQKNEQFFGTDSECLLDNIDERGLKDTLEDTRGAWALTWYDTKDDTLNFIRNSQRTLFMARRTETNELFWCSELGLLTWVLDRNDIKDYETLLLRENLHLSFDLFSVDWLSKLTMAEISGKEESRTIVPSITHFLQGEGEATSQQEAAKAPQASGTGSTESKSFLMTNPGSESENESKNTTTLSGSDGSRTEASTEYTHRGFQGNKIDRSTLLQLLENGCINCESVSPPKRPFRFMAETVYLCEDCMKDPGVVAMVENRIQLFDDGSFDAVEYMQ